jgi:hypothetical protein
MELRVGADAVLADVEAGPLLVTVFLARQNPDSTQAKPRFMKNTRTPPP